ncbi:MAG TPA: hypothetical protein VFD70_18810 [Anaerolineae bacterium]|nr:hypothetical protein [Anaerolineae bacterium]
MGTFHRFRAQFFVLLMAGLLVPIVLANLSPSARAETPAALATADVCYGVEQKAVGLNLVNRLARINLSTGTATIIGQTGTSNITNLAFQPFTNVLFAADGGQLGKINLTTGAFTATAQSIGSGTGSQGRLNFTSIKGLHFDPITQQLYGTVRRSQQSENDLLIKIDPITGAHIPNAFGSGVDYVVISGALENIDDIVITKGGLMYGSSNLGNVLGQDELVRINKQTGAATVIGPFHKSPLEGMTLAKDGTLYGSTGKEGNTPDNLWKINMNTGNATLVGPFVHGTDYEGLACQLDLPTPTPKPSATNTPTVTRTPTNTLTPTNTPSISLTPTNTPTASLTPTATNTPSTVATTTTTPTATPCTTKPGPVSLLLPKKNKLVTKHWVALDWNDVRCANHYKVVVRHNSPQGPIALAKVVFNRSSAMALHLPSGTYYWHVFAFDSHGISKSRWQSFQIK